MASCVLMQPKKSGGFLRWKFVDYLEKANGNYYMRFSIECRKPIIEWPQWPIIIKENTLNSQSEFKIKTSKLLLARESAGDPVGIGFSFESDWLTEWRECSGPITEQISPKLVQSRIALGTQSKIARINQKMTLIPVFLLLQVAEFEGQGTATTGKRQLSRRELEEELENVKRVNKHFYNFAVRELMDEVYQATGKGTTWRNERLLRFPRWNLCFLFPKESHTIEIGSASSQSLFPEAEPVKTRTNFANVKGLSSL